MNDNTSYFLHYLKGIWVIPSRRMHRLSISAAVYGSNGKRFEFFRSFIWRKVRCWNERKTDKEVPEKANKQTLIG